MSASDDTRSRIRQAALDTVRRHGIKGTSARSIARTGDFNQALIFYHFGGVNELLMDAAVADSEERVARYRERLEQVASLPELVAVARELHRTDAAEGGIAVVTQLLAGAAGDPEMAKRLLAAFDPWIDLVDGALGRALAGTGLDQLVPTGQAAYAIVALFLGIELLTRLDPDNSRAPELFATLDGLGVMMGALFPGSGGR